MKLVRAFAVFPLFILLSVSTTAHATSGACSYHNGVNCGVGADLDGSVICNDGWEESTVSYADANECQSSNNSHFELCYASLDIDCEDVNFDYRDLFSEKVNLYDSYSAPTESGYASLLKCAQDSREEKVDYDNFNTTYSDCSNKMIDSYNNASLKACLEVSKQCLESKQLLQSANGVFSDVPERHKNTAAISYLHQKGIIQGYNDGTFKPENNINRAELLKILIEGRGISPSLVSYNNCFPDVKNEWFAAPVCYAQKEGWIQGYNDGSFRPEQTISKAEAIKMLINSQGISVRSTVDEIIFVDVNLNDWFAPYIYKAKELNLLEETGFWVGPNDEMTRGGIAENLYRILTIADSV